jgi:hypothetical protein
MSQEPVEDSESVSNERKLRKQIDGLIKLRNWTIIGGLAAGASSANRHFGGMSPDWHVLPKWFGLVTALVCAVYVLFVSLKIRRLSSELPQPGIAGRVSDGRTGLVLAVIGWQRATSRKLLATRKARILAGSVGGALLLCSAVASHFVLSSHSLLKHRLSSCEVPWRERGQRIPPAEHNRCISEAARLWSMPEYCDGFEAGEFGVTAAAARAWCRSKVAEQLGDLDLCKNSGTAAATKSCLQTLAVRAEDASLCAQIPDVDSADRCLAEVAIGAMRSEPCLQLKNESQRGDCLTKLVSNGGDISACAPIRELAKRNACYLAAARINPGACPKVTADRRAECLNWHLELLDDLDAACGGWAPCLSALLTSSTAPCALIPDDQAALRVQCFVEAFGRRIPWTCDSECERLQAQKLRDACFSGLGRRVEHAEICLKALDPAMRKECVLVAGKNDASQCLALNDAADARRCVSESNLGKTIDASVCRLLPEHRQTGCAQRVTSNLEAEVRNAR